MQPLDHEAMAKADIIARPEVTGDGLAVLKQKPVESASEALSSENMEPDGLERAASKVISNAVDNLKQMAGMDADGDFNTLMTETLGGFFAAIRTMSGKPWLRFAVAAGALGISIIPPVLR